MLNRHGHPTVHVGVINVRLAIFDALEDGAGASVMAFIPCWAWSFMTISAISHQRSFSSGWKDVNALPSSP